MQFERAQRGFWDTHRSADAGCGTALIDAVNSAGAIEAPVSAQVLIRAGFSLRVGESRRYRMFRAVAYHWCLTER